MKKLKPQRLVESEPVQRLESRIVYRQLMAQTKD
jgi:hypothetical protein